MHQVNLTLKSRNNKTGPIPVSTTEDTTCPPSCPLKKAGCYADAGPLGMFWKKVNEKRAGDSWDAFVSSVRDDIKPGQLWRHNQAGDLPGIGDDIALKPFMQLVIANQGKRGFTYTHKPMNNNKNKVLVRQANKRGFTVNLSANNAAHADELSELGIAPVVVVLPSDNVGNTKTPAGRDIIQCPATYENSKTTCKDCGLCARNMIGTKRRKIVGFPAHGVSKKKASAIATENASGDHAGHNKELEREYLARERYIR